MRLGVTVGMGSVVALVAVYLGVVGLYASSGGDLCSNHIHAEYMSPDRTKRTVVFGRNCGATTGFSTHLSVLRAGEALENESGNVYIIDGHPKQVELSISWKSDSELVVRRPLSGAEYKAASIWGSDHAVSIRYGSGNE